jgi:hypothetical protein
VEHVYLLRMRRITIFVVTIVFSIAITLVIPRVSQSQTAQYYDLNSAIVQAYGSQSRARLLPEHIPLPFISKSFSGSELKKIVDSLFFLNGFLAPTVPTVRSCIERYANKDLVTERPVTISVGALSRQDTVTPNGSVSAFWDNWTIAVNGRQTQRTNISKQSVYIEKYSIESNEMGHATFINWRYNDSPQEPFRIFLNAYNLNKSQARTDNAGNGITDQFVWAEIIFHELLHNMGYNHADVLDGNFQPVVGNFVYEAGWCVKRAGRTRPSGDFGLTSSGDSDGLFVDNVSGRPMTPQQPTNPPNSGANPTDVIVDPNSQPQPLSEYGKCVRNYTESFCTCVYVLNAPPASCGGGATGDIN